MDEELNLLRLVELRLLRCSLSPAHPPPPLPSSPSPSPLLPLVESLLNSIERGQYAAALSSDAVSLVFEFAGSWEFDDSREAAARFYAEVEKSAELFLRNHSPPTSEAWLQVVDAGANGEAECSFAILMCLGVAALLAFTQQNLAGPIGDFSPFPLPIPWPKENVGKRVDGGEEWDAWAQLQIMSVGSDLLGKISHLQYIAIADMLFSKIRQVSMERRKSHLAPIRSISWWLCRLTLLKQRILDDLSSSLFDLLEVLKKETLLQFGKAENVTHYWDSMLYKEEASTIASVAHLEAAVIEDTYGLVDSSRSHLKFAEEACGMHLSVTGALGFRTIHQADPKAQMVLVTNSDQLKQGDKSFKEVSQTQTSYSTLENKMESCSNGDYESCDILMKPRLVESGNSSTIDGNAVLSKVVSLTAAQQAVVLAQCLNLKRSSRDDEISRWKMAPFIEAIDSQQASCYMIKCFCDILRIRWESTRSRTKERALLMMDKLVEVLKEPLPDSAERIQFSYGVYVPLISALRKEYGELLVSCGMIGEALQIFEDLQLWDNLIYCYRLLGKKAAAVDLINKRLSETPTDPRLWCSLGDATNNDAYYEKALKVSNNKSVRAKRSLARSSYNRGEFETSKILWESAMAQNSLYPDGWFALGAAALKARDIDKALDAFTRAVQLDPENGEAWNNIAGLHMIKKKSKEAFVAFKEALKFKRNSWELWENYSHVALDIGNYSQALEANRMVLDLSSNKRVDFELLSSVMAKVEERFSKATPCACSTNLSTESSDESAFSEVMLENPRETELLMDMLGNMMQQVIRSGGGGGIWGLYARWHKLKGNLIMCSEALLKQVRSYQGSDLWHNLDRFRKFADASLQLCQIYMEIAWSTGSNKELLMAEMHLKNSVKQAVDFSDTKEFRDLQACLDEVKKRLDTPTDVASLVHGS